MTDSPSHQSRPPQSISEPVSGRLIVRGSGDHSSVVSHRVLLIRAKKSSRLANLPGGLEAIVEQMTLSGNLAFGYRELIATGALPCSIALEDFEDTEEGVIQRGSWLISGRLGLVAGKLVFEAADSDYKSSLGKVFIGIRDISIRPKRIIIDRSHATLGSLSVTYEKDRPLTSNPLLRATFAYLDHVQAFDETRSDEGRIRYTVVTESWRCATCGAETLSSDRKCVKCGALQRLSPFTRATVRLRAQPGAHGIRRGDQVIARADGEDSPPLTVDRLDGRTARLAFRRDRPLPPQGELRPAVNTQLFEAQRAELTAIQDGNRPRLLALINTPADVIGPKLSSPQPSISGVPVPNELQAHAIQQIGGMSDGDVYLIQGPPGTGKTFAVAQAIAQLSRDADTRILFSSHSNDAVDSGQTKLRAIPGVRQARLADPSRVTDDVRDLVLGDRTIAGLNVVAGTTARLTVDSRLSGEEFDWLILDEANKVRFSEALPLMARAARWVLIGDPFQLGPISDDASASFKSDDEAASLVRDSSLYEWLWRRIPPSSRTMLLQQYRMAWGIGSVVSKLFYEDKLELSGPTDSIGLAWPLNRQILWVDTGLQAETRAASGSLANSFEVAISTDLCRLLARAAPLPRVAVISMYAEQVSRLERALVPIIPEVEVASVDSFEGREADVVILSLVRSNVGGRIGFLEDAKRVNVALSRAQRLLVVIGDATTVSSGSPDIFGKLLAHIGELQKSGVANIVGPGAVVTACQSDGVKSAIRTLSNPIGKAHAMRRKPGMPARGRGR